jgi:type IV secretory pathway VirB10-like protein
MSPRFDPDTPYEAESDPLLSRPVHVTRVDVPFLDLLWLFLKSSVALALAFVLTSWLWVGVATGTFALLAACLWLLGVPRLVAPPPPAPAPVAIAAPAPAAPPPPAPDPAAEDAPPAPPPEPVAPPVPRDPNRAATEALQRQEIERHRGER